MSDSIFAAASTTGAGSSERIANEFMAQGRPTNPAEVSRGEVLGGFPIKTPKVGDGFTEWAIAGYDLDGKIKNPPVGVDYDRHGDWLFDKAQVMVPGSTGEVYDKNYLEPSKK